MRSFQSSVGGAAGGDHDQRAQARVADHAERDLDAVDHRLDEHGARRGRPVSTTKPSTAVRTASTRGRARAGPGRGRSCGRSSGSATLTATGKPSSAAAAAAAGRPAVGDHARGRHAVRRQRIAAASAGSSQPAPRGSATVGAPSGARRASRAGSVVGGGRPRRAQPRGVPHRVGERPDGGVDGRQDGDARERVGLEPTEEHGDHRLARVQAGGPRRGPPPWPRGRGCGCWRARAGARPPRRSPAAPQLIGPRSVPRATRTGVDRVGWCRRCRRRAARSVPRRSSERAGTSSPYRAAVSAARTPSPPALPEDREPRPGGKRLLGEQQGGLGQLLGVATADHAGLGEQGVDPDRRGRGGGRVRGAGALRRSPDRPPTTASSGLRLGEAAADAGELRRVAERLEVERGGGDVGVVVPRREQVVARDVGLVAEGDEVPDAQPEATGEVDDDDADATGLGGDRQAAGRRVRAGEGRATAGRRAGCRAGRGSWARPPGCRGRGPVRVSSRWRTRPAVARSRRSRR